VDSYTDEHYNVSLFIDKDGSPKIERIYGNPESEYTTTLALRRSPKCLSELQGPLKVSVKAESFSETEEKNPQGLFRLFH
jgi:hypothetical protein